MTSALARGPMVIRQARIAGRCRGDAELGRADAGVPVGVLGNQDACVIAKSYEMKATGVKTGVPIWDALKLCPDGLYVKRDFRWYEVLSRAMLAVMRDLSTAVEYYSIDEFPFDATPPRGLDPQQYAVRIRDAIW